MTREESKYCEECKNCDLIEYVSSYYIHCSKRRYRFDDAVIYCKYKKLKRRERRNVKRKR